MSKNIDNVKSTASDKARWFDRSRIFGYDFFISFKLGPPPMGAQSYASDLARRLRELDFTVFFSEEEAPPGLPLNPVLVKALHRSRILVVIANEGALMQFLWVRKEVEEFRQKHPKRPIIPINVNRAIERFGQEAGVSEWLDHDGRIWLDETSEAIADGITSPALVDRLKVTLRFIRSNTWFRWTVTTIILMLIGLTSWARYEAWYANAQFRDASVRKLVAEAQGILAGNLVGNDIHAYLQILAANRLKRENGKNSRVDSVLLQALVAGIDKYKVTESPSLITALAISPDGNRIIFSNGDTLCLWDTHTGQPIGLPLLGHKGEVSSIAFSPDGSRIISGDSEETLHLWDAKTGQPIGQPLRGHKGMITSVAFSPNGTRLVSGSGDNTLRLWDAKTGQAIGQPLRGHEDSVTSVAFSPDGSRLVSGGWDHTLRMWNIPVGQLFGQSLKGHEDMVADVAFSPGSRYFCENLFRGILAPTSGKNHATAIACGDPDSSASPRFDPTRGRNLGST